VNFPLPANVPKFQFLNGAIGRLRID